MNISVMAGGSSCPPSYPSTSLRGQLSDEEPRLDVDRSQSASRPQLWSLSSNRLVAGGGGSISRESHQVFRAVMASLRLYCID